MKDKTRVIAQARWYYLTSQQTEGLSAAPSHISAAPWLRSEQREMVSYRQAQMATLQGPKYWDMPVILHLIAAPKESKTNCKIHS